MIYLLSSDKNIINLLNTISSRFEAELFSINNNSESCEVLSRVCEHKPTVIIVDDDGLKFSSEKFISSLKSICPETAIIFLTSDSSIALGRSISPFGIQYYGIKPVSEAEIYGVLKSILNKHSINH